MEEETPRNGEDYGQDKEEETGCSSSLTERPRLLKGFINIRLGGFCEVPSRTCGMAQLATMATAARNSSARFAAKFHCRRQVASPAAAKLPLLTLRLLHPRVQRISTFVHLSLSFLLRKFLLSLRPLPPPLDDRLIKELPLALIINS